MQNTANKKVDIKCLKKEDLCSEIHATKSPQLIENVNDEGEQNANDSECAWKRIVTIAKFCSKMFFMTLVQIKDNKSCFVTGPLLHLCFTFLANGKRLNLEIGQYRLNYFVITKDEERLGFILKWKNTTSSTPLN